MNAPINVKFMVAKSIKHWTYPCIMCLQNLQKKCDLEEYVEKNNISEFSSILDVDTGIISHTLTYRGAQCKKWIISLQCRMFEKIIQFMCSPYWRKGQLYNKFNY